MSCNCLSRPQYHRDDCSIFHTDGKRKTNWITLPEILAKNPSAHKPLVLTSAWLQDSQKNRQDHPFVQRYKKIKIINVDLKDMKVDIVNNLGEPDFLFIDTDEANNNQKYLRYY
jgi:hypothetical protein